MNRLASIAILLWLCLSALPAHAQSCRQALVLGLDVSLSVDVNEFRLQREGLARALTDPEVMDAMIGAPDNRVDLAVFEWSGQYNQTLLIGWTTIDNRVTLRAISDSLFRQPQGMRSGRTAIGAAMLYARDLLRERPGCAVRTLDLSGDGRNNNGIAPLRARRQLAGEGITVNALTVEPDPARIVLDRARATVLSRYFQDNVITGPTSFVEPITAIKRKLLRELTPALSWRDAGQ